MAVAIDKTDYVMRGMYNGANSLILSPDSHNPAHTDIVISGDHEVELKGVVVWFQSAEEMK